MKIEDFYNAPRHAGIYMFRNLLNGKCYIGQAKKLRKRLLRHLSNLKNERYDAPIYKALKKYGLENFELKILQTFHDALGSRTKQLLDYWEIKYIEEYNSYGSTGYNQTKGGDGGITGYHFTESQKNKVRKKQLKIANDGRYTVYCYIIAENKVIKATSMAALAKQLNIKINNSDLRHSICKKNYLIARDKESFQKKIADFKSGKLNIDESKYKTLLTEDMKVDILSGMSQKEFISKYNVCKKTFINYRKKINPTYKREYKTKVNLDIFREYLSCHSIKECAIHFNISIDLAYKYKAKLREKVFN